MRPLGRLRVQVSGEHATHAGRPLHQAPTLAEAFLTRSRRCRARRAEDDARHIRSRTPVRSVSMPGRRHSLPLPGSDWPCARARRVKFVPSTCTHTSGSGMVVRRRLTCGISWCAATWASLPRRTTAFPTLSDMVTAIAHMLPKRQMSATELARVIERRHKLRENAKESHRRRQPASHSPTPSSTATGAVEI